MTRARLNQILLQNVLMNVAEFERSIIKERVNAGLAAARERGVKLGRQAHWQQARRMTASSVQSVLKSAG